MYVCLCADQDSDSIKKLIADGITDINEIVERTGVGTGCGTCQRWVEKMVEEEVSLSS